MSCGDFSSERIIYFRSPGFPQSYYNSKMCRLRVGKKDRNVCQYRVDMNTFEVAPPLAGNCSQDVFVVSGQNENNIIPKICGRNNGQHCKCLILWWRWLFPFTGRFSLSCVSICFDFLVNRLFWCRWIRSDFPSCYDDGIFWQEVWLDNHSDSLSVRETSSTQLFAILHWNSWKDEKF